MIKRLAWFSIVYPVAALGQPVQPLPAALFAQLGFSDKQRADIDAGRPVAQVRNWGKPSEVYVFGAELEQTLDKAGKTIEIDDAALDLIAVKGYSLAFGAHVLKRVIDERIKVPLTLRWKDAAHFRVRVYGGSVVVDALTPRAAASFRPASYLDVA